MLAKINSYRGAGFILALALLFSGCTPAGPRALLKGKRYLDRGDIADALPQLKRATTLLPANANAWNYYGVALQRANQPDEAATAYQTALRLDHDLVEAHYNLGVLSLEQNKAETAKSELTTYTLRRPNDPAGWLKLGLAQLKSGGETMTAERSFSEVRALKGDDAEVYNGMGLAYLQAGKPRDAAKFFTAAVQLRPDFASALQNLATVNLQYLHDTRAALAEYQAYLTLTPRPADYDDVKAIVASLTTPEAVPAPAPTPVPAPAVTRTSAPPPETRPNPETRPRIANATPSHPAPANRTESEERYASRSSQRTANNTTPVQTPTAPSVQTQTVQVPSEPEIVASPKNRPTAATASKTLTNPVVASQGQLETPAPDEEQSKPGFWQRYFGSDKSASAKRYREDNVTPLPGSSEETAPAKPEQAVEPQPHPQPQPVVSFNRYHYTSPPKPAAGNRQAAEGAATKAGIAEQDERWSEAEQSYQTAATFDPSWFEMQYDTAVVAQRLHHYSVALPRYELALAIQPDSVDARYYFAVALKAAGYPVDAADELKKLLAANPNEVRAHLTLATICAQTLHDIPEARKHYLRVLALQPDNPEAANIRDWLSANGR